MPKITKITAREILDSRGNPTIEVEVFANKLSAKASVPSGASTGTNEALELRDGDKKRFKGKGVLKAVNNVKRKISPKLKGMDFTNQKKIDKAMIQIDGTPNKSKLGANAILGVSLAVARLNALHKKKDLFKTLNSKIKGKKGKKIMPTPFMNVINGGRHADNDLMFQEFMIVPQGKTFEQSLEMGSEVYHILKKIIAKKFKKSSTNVGDEGGFAPSIGSAKQALDLLMKAIEASGYSKKIKIAMDVAASEFFDQTSKEYFMENRYFTADELIALYLDLAKNYPIISIEDPFHEECFDEFAKLLKLLKKRKTKEKNVQIVGDDLLVTNVKRIKNALKKKACNALLLKVNQIGTLSEAIDAANLAMNNGWKVMVSHRSGETCDSFIADLAVGLGTGQIKSGAPCRGERMSKYNRLLEIEKKIKK